MSLSRYENELAMHQMVEADITSLKAVMVELSRDRTSLKEDIEGLNLELFRMKKTHEEVSQSITQRERETP